MVARPLGAPGVFQLLREKKPAGKLDGRVELNAMGVTGQSDTCLIAEVSVSRAWIIGFKTVKMEC